MGKDIKDAQLSIGFVLNSLLPMQFRRDAALELVARGRRDRVIGALKRGIALQTDEVDRVERVLANEQQELNDREELLHAVMQMMP